MNSCSFIRLFNACKFNLIKFWSEPQISVVPPCILEISSWICIIDWPPSGDRTDNFCLKSRKRLRGLTSWTHVTFTLRLFISVCGQVDVTPAVRWQVLAYNVLLCPAIIIISRIGLFEKVSWSIKITKTFQTPPLGTKCKQNNQF